jgi:iron complex outermembrane receptor protein
MWQYCRRLFIVVVTVGAPPCGNAWADEYPAELDYFQELPVVLSASRLLQPISETPNAMTVIDRDMIVASGARNIADVFRLVPSMYVGYASGHSPIVSYRGITDEYARRMQVLVDGRSVYLPIFGQVDWAELPLDIGDIERIEVIRGPSAASHGANSVQGVINISTYRASDVHGMAVSARRGGAGISDVSARFGGMGERWDYRVTLASRADNGFVPNPGVNTIPLNDDSHTQLFNTRIAYRPTASDSVDIQFGYSDSSRMRGDLLPIFNSPVREQKTSSDYEQATWLHTFDADSDFQLNYYHIGRDTRDERYSVPVPNWGVKAPGSYLFAENAVIHRHDIEMQHTLRTSPDNRVVWGMGARHDSANAPNLLLYSPTWREYRLFVHDEWRITSASLVNVGAMAEKNGLGQARVSPRASYNHHLTPRDTLRASISVAYRNPEMVEELGNQPVALAAPWKWNNFAATGGLGPEKGVSREVGYLRQLDETGSTLDLRAFHDQISNIIWVDFNYDPAVYAPSVVTPKSFKSDFNAYYSGLEATLKYVLGARSKLTVNYAHQTAGASPSRASNYAYTAYAPALNAALNAAFDNALMAYAHKFSQTVPLNSASLLLAHDFSGGLQLGVGLYHIDPVRSLDAGTIQPLTRYMDLRVARRFGSARSKQKGLGSGEIALVLKNALSDHHFDYSSQTINKRLAYFTVTMEF